MLVGDFEVIFEQSRKERRRIGTEEYIRFFIVYKLTRDLTEVL